MAPPRYIYQRRGGPLVTWNRLRPPAQTRAADAASLGSLGDTDVFDQARRLPRGGAPEYIADGLSGCGCGGKAKPGASSAMGCCGVMGDDAPASSPTITASSAVTPLSMAGAAAATFHGYKRNGSILWALVWGALGGFAPLTTNVVAVAQGFGKKKGA